MDYRPGLSVAHAHQREAPGQEGWFPVAKQDIQTFYLFNVVQNYILPALIKMSEAEIMVSQIKE